MRLRVKMSGLLFSFLFGLSLISYSDAILAAMSVDFGTQFMKIALVKPGVPMEIVLNKESKRKTANIVGFKNDERFFGDSALTLATKSPKTTFTNLIDLLGKKVDNPVVTLYKERNPFLNIVPDEARETVQFTVNDETYKVETLVAMILDHARKLTEDFAGQPVKDVVIAVPAYFNQAERRAMAKAAEIADLNLLQILNDHSACGLSYGIFRRKEITDEPQTLMIYDMGAGKTTAAILEYRLEKEKKGSEKNPVMSTLGYGYDRTLGGLEISLRMRDHLVKEFKKQFKTNEDITKNPRAMAKMFKEAERVKGVLSANADHFAQVESVHEDKDFKMRVTRAELEEMIKDLEPRMIKPIEDALKMAEMTMEQVDQIVLMGAATRVPKVQELVRGFFKGKELSKFLNTDESIAMGAVYQAAHLSKGFKVKKFAVRDLQIAPIQVDFMTLSKKDGVGERLVHRPIFGYKTYYPSSKKILSFSSFTKDFSISVNYGDMKHLDERQLSEFGSLNISDVDLNGITKAYDAEMSTEGAVYKGIKAHFNMDDSGVVFIEGAELYVEKPPKEESAFASLAGKITGLFSSGGAKEEAKEEKEVKKPEADDTKAEETKETPEAEAKRPEEDATKKEGANQTNTTTGEGKDADEKKKNETEAAKKEENKPKVVKVALEINERRLDVNVLSSSETQAEKKRLAKFAEMEKKKAEREEAHNLLESLVYDVSDKLEQPNLKGFITDSEREAVEQEVKRVRAWLEDDVGIETTTDEFVKNKKAIDKLLKPVLFRIKEHNARPAMIADLLSLFNHSEIFVFLGKNLTEAGMFTEVEISTLEKALDETKEWWKEKNATQKTLKPTDEPAYTTEDLKEKIRNLDRELRYLVNKMKYAKPKAKKEDKDANETKTEGGNETVVEEGKSTAESEEGEKPESQAPAPETAEGQGETLQLEGDKKVCEGDSCPEKEPPHDADEL